MDTVRAGSLGLYGYPRDTTPNLARWAAKGVRFDRAVAAAPWTFPSHCCFLTGQWPSRLEAHWLPALHPSYPTLAEYLRARGYLTAGFVANTYWCSYESRMDRGFAHYEDYPLTPRTVLASTVPGRWLVEQARAPWDYYGVKWVRAQSRDARGINRDFLAWLDRRPGQGGRPFFAFLNYLDAHEPFVPPRSQGPWFGLHPRSGRDYRMLLDYWDREKQGIPARDVRLALDSYDACIAALDREVGALLDDLAGRGLLRDTLVILTSDHGEEFGEHGVFNHGFSLYAPEVHVPLVILPPGGAARPGLAVAEPVSLRDLPATVVGVAGLAAGSPFPGRSLADLWQADPGRARPPGSPALSEVDIPAVFDPRRGRGPKQREFTVSLVADDRHYIVDVRGAEELFDLKADPGEQRDLTNDPALNSLRTSLLRTLTGDPVNVGVAGRYLARLRSLLESLTGSGAGPKG
jgi:arylsulfatase A-like enzyme